MSLSSPRKLVASLFVATVMLLAAAPRAEAGFGVGASIGTGFVYTDSMNRASTNLEIMPTYKFAIFNFDLGMKFNLEETPVGGYDFTFRPGVRVSLPVIPIYFRAAIPLRATSGGDYGFLFGIGWSMGIGPISLFIEADGNFSNELKWSNPGVDFRLGAQFSF